MNDHILIEIYGGTNPDSAPDKANEQGAPQFDSYEDLVESLKRSFGSSVTVEYIDTDVKGIQNEKCRKLIGDGKRFPITVINGEPCIVGGISIKLVRRFLDKIAFQIIEQMNAPKK